MKYLMAVLLIFALPVKGQEYSESDYLLPPLEDLRAMAERPLFMPGRRGVVEDRAPVASLTAVPPAASVMLSGIGWRGDGQGVALLRRGVTARTLAPGQEWGGWRLVGVGQASVDLLSSDGARHSLRVGQSLSDPVAK